MPNDTRTPAAQGSYNQATLIVGSSKPSAMAANDDGGSYIYITPPGSLVDSYTTSGWPSPIASVSNWTLLARGGHTGGGSPPTAQVGIICPHGSAAGGNTTAAWWTNVGSYSPAHPGGGSWSAADCVNTTELDVVATSGTDTTAFSYVQLNYDYTLAGGSFMSFNSLLLPLLGGQLTLDLFAGAMRRGIASLDRPWGWTRFLPHEFAEYWGQWQAYRHPRHFCLEAA